MKFEDRAIRPSQGVPMPENVTEWPKMVYRRDADGNLAHKIISSEAEGEGWFSSPADVPEAEARPTVTDDALKAENTRLRAGIEQAKADFRLLAEENERLKAMLEASAKDPVETVFGRVAIPENWRELHHSTLRGIARKIKNEDVASTEEAVSVIEQELARRGNAD